MNAQRVIIGVDPGLHGSIAVIADNQFRIFHDLPTRTTRNGKQELDGGALADILESEINEYPGAEFLAMVEQVNAMPPKHDKPCPVCKKSPGMGATSAFSFGGNFGMIRGVLESMRIPYELIVPQSWKARLGMKGTAKDYSRTKAAQLYPTSAPFLQRKKDIGRSDALLIAHAALLPTSTQQVKRNREALQQGQIPF